MLQICRATSCSLLLHSPADAKSAVIFAQISKALAERDLVDQTDRKFYFHMASLLSLDISFRTETIDRFLRSAGMSSVHTQIVWSSHNDHGLEMVLIIYIC